MNLTKLARPLAPAAVAALCVGCVDWNMPNAQMTDDNIRQGFSYVGRDLSALPAEAGAWGYEYWFFNPNARVHRYIFSGPGELFWLRSGSNGAYTLEPVDFSAVYENWGSRPNNSMVYRPPVSNDDVPMGGASATFASEALNPESGNWIRSPDYTFRIVRREEMGFHLTLYGPDGMRNVFLTTVEPVVVNVQAGATQKFYACPEPCPVEGVQAEFGLVPPTGYSGDPGRLSSQMVEDSAKIPPPTSYPLEYWAPDNVASPTDIVAWVSVNDPWAKKRQRLEITFRVTPK